MKGSMKNERRAKRVIGYSRVSTNHQAQHGLSLAAQEEKIRAYAALHDIEVVEIIRDAGHSAWEPGTCAALVAACERFKLRLR